MWRDVLDTIDSVELWLVELPVLVQIPLLLVVFIPVCWWSAKVIDRLVERLLRRHTAREAQAWAAGADPAAQIDENTAPVRAAAAPPATEGPNT